VESNAGRFEKMRIEGCGLRDTERLRQGTTINRHFLSVFICLHLWRISSSSAAEFQVHLGQFAGPPIQIIQMPHLSRVMAHIGLRPPFIDARQTAERMLNGLNHGSPIIAPLIFDHRDFGIQAQPIDHLAKLIRSTVGLGFRVLRTDGQSPQQTAAMLLGPESQMTVYLLNQSLAASAISIQGLPPGKAFRQQVWNGDGDGKTGFDRSLIVDLNGRIDLQAPPRSVIALSAR
jgi:hypothetical protein